MEGFGKYTKYMELGEQGRAAAVFFLILQFLSYFNMVNILVLFLSESVGF